MDKYVLSMSIIRFISGSLEIIAGLIMMRLNQVDRALIINTGLAFVGPLIFIITSAIGLLGIAYRISFGRLSWILLGVCFILFGIVKK